RWDCDQNARRDELEQLAADTEASGVIVQGSSRFADSRETLGYGDMISQYGRPWKPDTDRVSEVDPSQPAEFLRAKLRIGGCGTVVKTSAAADRYLRTIGFPAVKEIHSVEMTLGNEAYADALDPTIAIEGSAPNDLSDRFVFRGVPGIRDLLDER